MTEAGATRSLGPTEPIPLTVLTGFLGAGKTSLLNRLITDPALADTAVIINEFGEIGLDHLLVKPIKDGMVLLQSGCLCCTLRGDLVEALEQLLRDLDNGRVAFRRVMLETTGLADPAPVLQTIAALASEASGQRGHSKVRAPDTRPEPGSSARAALASEASGQRGNPSEVGAHSASEDARERADDTRPEPGSSARMAHPYLVMRYRLDGVITVVDAVNGAATLDQHMESVKQVAVADRLVLTKTDLIDTPERREAKAGLVARLRALNPAAAILDAAANEATPQRILGCGLFDPDRKIPDVKRWLAAEAYAEPRAHDDHHHDHDHHDVNRHDERIRAFSLAADAAIPAAMFDMFLELLRAVHGPNLLRLKGIVKIAESPESPLVIHGVQHIFHPPVRLPRWPDRDERTRIVLITRDLQPDAVKRLFDAFVGAAAPDQPDRAALIDNPLVPFGGVDR